MIAYIDIFKFIFRYLLILPRLISLILFLSVSLTCLAQISNEFVYKGDQNIGLTNLIVHNDQIYVAGVYTETVLTRDVFVMELDKEGNVTQAKVLGTSSRESVIPNSFFMNPSNNVSFFGHTLDGACCFGADNFFNFTFDEDLNLSERNTWGSDQLDETIRNIMFTSDGGIIAVGGFGWDIKGGMILKLDQNLETEWIRVYPHSSTLFDFGNAVETDTKDIVVVGVHLISLEESKLNFSKLDQNGNAIVERQYEFENTLFNFGSEKVFFRNNQIDLFINSTDENGTQQPYKIVFDINGEILSIQRILSTPRNYQFSQIKQNNDGKYICVLRSTNTQERKSLIGVYSDDRIEELHSFESPEYNQSISDFTQVCDSDDCEYYIGLNFNNGVDSSQFKIITTDLNCPNESSDIFNYGTESFIEIPALQSSLSAIDVEPFNIDQKSIEIQNESFDRELDIELGTDSLICAGSEIEISSFNENADFYEWSTGETTSSIVVSQPGLYQVTLSDACGRLFEDEIEIKELEFDALEIYYPNIFTPNGDGVNDCFNYTFSKEEIIEFSVQIYDRWGNKVFQSESTTDCWDGRYKGQRAASEVYLIKLRAIYPGCTGEPVLFEKVGDVLIH